MQKKKTPAERLDWMVKNWDVISGLNDYDVLELMLKEKLYSVKTVKRDVLPSVTKMLEGLKNANRSRNSGS